VNEETRTISILTPRATLWELLVHIIAGTTVFVTIALVAASLNFLVRWLLLEGVSQFIGRGLQFAEYFLFVVDLILFVVFIGRTALRFLRGS
jgi:hypothetical protein